MDDHSHAYATMPFVFYSSECLVLVLDNLLAAQNIQLGELDLSRSQINLNVRVGRLMERLKNTFANKVAIKNIVTSTTPSGGATKVDI